MVINQVGAVTSPASSVIPITPCRLLDTRPAPDNVGTRVGALGQQETLDVAVVGTNGNCTIPAGATAIVANITIANPTSASFLTIFPTGDPRPLTAGLNWVAGQAPTGNQATIALSASGSMSLFNSQGSVDVIVDIVSYMQATTGGGALVHFAPVNVVAVLGVAAASGGPTPTTGTALFAPIPLPAGQYLVSTTAQFFDSLNNTEGEAVGHTRSWLCTNATTCPNPGVDSWSSIIPDDPNSGAQASGSSVINVPAGGLTLVTRSVVRGGLVGGTYYGGSNVIVTRLGA